MPNPLDPRDPTNFIFYKIITGDDDDNGNGPRPSGSPGCGCLVLMFFATAIGFMLIASVLK